MLPKCKTCDDEKSIKGVAYSSLKGGYLCGKHNEEEKKELRDTEIKYAEHTSSKKRFWIPETT